MAAQRLYQRLSTRGPDPKECVSRLRNSSTETDGRAGKLKFNFKGSDPWSQPFIRLLQNRRDEIILRDPDQLQYIADAAEESLKMPGADSEKLGQLQMILERKMGLAGLKAQLKPTFGGDDGDICEKLHVVVKWGGEFTHAARHQSRDIGENYGKDLRVMNKSVRSSSSRGKLTSRAGKSWTMSRSTRAPSVASSPLPSSSARASGPVEAVSALTDEQSAL